MNKKTRCKRCGCETHLMATKFDPGGCDCDCHFKMPNKTNKWEEEFDKKIDSDNYELGEYHSLKEPNDSLLDSAWYPESEREISEEKVKDFIRQLFQSQREEIAEEVEKEKLSCYRSKDGMYENDTASEFNAGIDKAIEVILKDN